MRETTLGVEELIGNPAAPLGSKPWALSIKLTLQQLVKESGTNHERLTAYVKLMTEHKGWRHLEDWAGKPFKSFEAFCLARRPYGLGRPKEEIDALIEERRAAQTAQAKAADPEEKPLADKAGRPKGNVENINIRPTGTSSSYIVRRLKRDHPEIAAKLAAGEYESARAAGIAAGIVKVPTPLDLLRRAWTKASKKERVAFLEWMEEQ